MSVLGNACLVQPGSGTQSLTRPNDKTLGFALRPIALFDAYPPGQAAGHQPLCGCICERSPDGGVAAQPDLMPP